MGRSPAFGNMSSGVGGVVYDSMMRMAAIDIEGLWAAGA